VKDVNKKTSNVVLTILAVIGGVAVLAVLGMWLMHAGMMGGAGMMNCCGGMMGGGLAGLLLIVAVVVAAFIILRRRTRL
jgi:uncharacterized membrane protein